MIYFWIQYSWAHSGGTDDYGCHAGTEPYHCHEPKYGSEIFEIPSSYTYTTPSYNASWSYGEGVTSLGEAYFSVSKRYGTSSVKYSCIIPKSSEEIVSEILLSYCPTSIYFTDSVAERGYFPTYTITKTNGTVNEFNKLWWFDNSVGCFNAWFKNDWLAMQGKLVSVYQGDNIYLNDFVVTSDDGSEDYYQLKFNVQGFQKSVQELHSSKCSISLSPVSMSCIRSFFSHFMSLGRAIISSTT